LLTVASLRPFLPELVELLTTSLLSSINSPRLNLVKASSSALFNLSRLCISESLSPEEDEIISIVVAVVETLKTLLQKPDAGESKELQRLLVVCIGGYVLLAKESSAVREILSGVEAGDVIGLVEGGVSQEVVGLISG
jgi:PUL domain